MFRLTSAVACAVAVAGSALVGLTTGTANAAPGCPDVHWMGAAGSGERTEYDMAANEGMGDIVYQSYQALRSSSRKRAAPSPPRRSTIRPRMYPPMQA